MFCIFGLTGIDRLFFLCVKVLMFCMFFYLWTTVRTSYSIVRRSDAHIFGRYVNLLFFPLKTTFLKVCKTTYLNQFFFGFPISNKSCRTKKKKMYDYRYSLKYKFVRLLFKIRSASTCTTSTNTVARLHIKLIFLLFT